MTFLCKLVVAFKLKLLTLFKIKKKEHKLEIHFNQKVKTINCLFSLLVFLNFCFRILLEPIISIVALYVF